MHRNWAVIGLAVWLAGPVGAQEEPLSSEARVAIDRLVRATWNGAAVANGFGLRARAAALFADSLLEAVAKAAQLTDEQRAALADVVRFELTEPGWLIHTRLEPGTYRLGMERTPRHLRWVLRDAKDVARATEAFWIGTGTDATPGNSTIGAGGVMVANLTVGAIEFSWRFIPESAHAAVTALPHVVTEGVVVLHTDLAHAGVRTALAKECAAAVPVHASLLGVPVPKEPLHLHLYATEAAYQEADALCTGGGFAAQGAFSSRLTGMAYVWYVPHASPIAFDDHGATRRMRALLVHELHHVIAYRFFRETPSWPKWLHEGLAELGTWQALGAHAPTDAEAFEERYRGAWQERAAVGAMPAMEDLLDSVDAQSRSAWYAGAFFLVRRLERERPGALAAWLPFIEGEPIVRDLAPRLRERLEREWKPTPRLYADLVAEAAAPPAPHLSFGHADRVGEAWRLISAPGNSVRLLWPGLLPGPNLTVEAEFAWHVLGAHQADVFLAYRGGRGTEQFLKLALLPKRIVLFRWRDGFWQTLGLVDFEHELTIGEPKRPTWHLLKVALDAAARTVRVETTGGRWAQFTLREYVPTVDTQVGVGCYDGAVFFRNVKAR